MDYSSSFKSSIYRMFYPMYGLDNMSYNSITSNQVYRKLGVIHLIPSTTIDVPSCFIRGIERAGCPECDTIVFPMFTTRANSMSKAMTGMDAILKYITRTSNRLAPFTLKNGTTYYGTSGLIFDGHLNPILECGQRYTVNDTHFAVSTGKYYLKVSENIFLEQDNTINKALIKKIIPYCLTNTIDFGYNYTLGERVLAKVDVVFVKEFTNFVTPSKPGYDNSPEKVSQFLMDNAGLVLDQFKYVH